jgi:hypothetical protein
MIFKTLKKGLLKLRRQYFYLKRKKFENQTLQRIRKEKIRVKNLKGSPIK